MADAQRKHELDLLASVILGKALTGALLLASEMKNEERIQLAFEGNGPLQRVFAEANATGAVRGYVSDNHAKLIAKENELPNLGDGLGAGFLTVSKTLFNEARPVNGTVMLNSGNIHDDIAHYLFQSEQVPSAVLIDVSLDTKGKVKHAGGILIQALPGANPEVIAQVEERLRVFDRISDLFEKAQYIDEIMHNALAPLGVKELQRTIVDFFCGCTQDKFTSALAMLDPTELKDMSKEDQELVCHYCGAKYVIPKETISEIHQSQQIRMN